MSKRQDETQALILGIYEGSVDIESLTDEQQEMVLEGYNVLATEWVTSGRDKFMEVGREILGLIEESGVEINDGGETLH